MISKYPYNVLVSKVLADYKMNQWLYHNCSNYAIDAIYSNTNFEKVLFNHSKDAIIFKLKWG